MDGKEVLDYETVCKLVGQLYLESRSRVEVISRQLQKSEASREDAARLAEQFIAENTTLKNRLRELEDGAP